MNEVRANNISLNAVHLNAVHLNAVLSNGVFVEGGSGSVPPVPSEYFQFDVTPLDSVFGLII